MNDPAAVRPTIAIVGAGRAGSTLALAAHQAGYTVAAVHTRRQERALPILEATGARWAPDLASVASSADLIFLAVPDDAITQVDEAGAAVWRRGSGVVHHSGMHSAAILTHAAAAGARTGALHPLQAITSPQAALPLLRGAYFGISGHPALMPVLHAFVQALGGHALLVPDEAKPLYHAAAVFASNYVVACFAQAVDILAGLGIASEEAARALLPLTRGAVANLVQPGLPHALTGPITRGDLGTLELHRRTLQTHRPDVLPLYQALGRATVPVAAAQGRLPDEAVRLMIEQLSRPEEEGIRSSTSRRS